MRVVPHASAPRGAIPASYEDRRSVGSLTDARLAVVSNPLSMHARLCRSPTGVARTLAYFGRGTCQRSRSIGFHRGVLQSKPSIGP